MNAIDTTSVAWLTEECSELNELAQVTANQSWKKSAGMFAGRPSHGGVLVVDDDPALRNRIRLILENAGYDILEARDGQEAINLLNSGECSVVVDAIITDLNIPKVDVFEIMAYCKMEYTKISLIVLTRFADMEMATSLMGQGICDYLVKPVDAEKLIASVEKSLLQRQRS